MKNENVIIKSVEYYDDRFYKISYPIELHEKFYKHIPERLINKTETDINIYLPSVTTILNKSENKSYLAKWRGDIGNERADYIISQALSKGSNIHTAITKLVSGYSIIYQNPKLQISDNWIGKIFPVYSQEEMIQVARFKYLYDLLQPIILDYDYLIHDLKHGYAGTLDMTVKLNGGEYFINSAKTKTVINKGVYVWDFKTGNTYSQDSTFMQMSAYSKSYYKKVTGIMGIHLNDNVKSGIKGVKIYQADTKQINKYFKDFLDYKKIFDKDENLKPVYYDIPEIINLNLNENEN